MASDPDRQTALDYHERTKHHPQQFARSLGYMDWANQPDPFRRYEGAETYELSRPGPADSPTYDQLFVPGSVPAAPLSAESVSAFFFDALALSAWKQAGGMPPWSLRVNPSSGNLHPTEAYLIGGAVSGLFEEPGVFHYVAFHHHLERRRTFQAETWYELEAQIPAGGVSVALSSIYWRESWKYGERAFRYCQHDAGHALAALDLAARAMGWFTRVVDIDTDDLELLLGIHHQTDVEAERGDCLVWVGPQDRQPPGRLRLPTSFREQCRRAAPFGQRNTLSREHHEWPVIDGVSRATRHRIATETIRGISCLDPANRGRLLPARRVIRGRRSAVAMDGTTRMDRESFFFALRRLLPVQNPVFGQSACPTFVSLVLFVHRVDDLEPGLYCLVRSPDHLDELRSAMSDAFEWRQTSDLPLFLLSRGDYRQQANLVSCRQDIASDGVFAVAMLARFEETIETLGASFYPRLFRETGMIGQMLYLEAEAAGIRGTGIGCFFDDLVHEMLGIAGREWQSLYHFTVGGPVEDPRIRGFTAYAHLDTDGQLG